MEKAYQQAIQCYADFLKDNISADDKVITYADIATINSSLGINVSVEVSDWPEDSYDS